MLTLTVSACVLSCVVGSQTDDQKLQLVPQSGHASMLTSARYSRDGKRIVTTSWDQTVRIWDAETGTELLPLVGHIGSGPVEVANFSPDGKRIVSGGGEGEVRVWDAIRGVELMTWSRSQIFPVDIAEYSPDGKYILTFGENGLCLRDASDGDIEWDLRELTSASVTCATFFNDGTHIAVGDYDGNVDIVDVQSRKHEGVRTEHEYAVRSISLSQDGKRMVTSSEDGTIRVCNPESGDVIWEKDVGADFQTRAEISPDGKRVAYNDERVVRILDASDGEESLTLTGHFDDVASLCYSPDSKRIVSAGTDSFGVVWDANTGEPLALLMGDSFSVTSVDFSQDTLRLAVGGGDGVARIVSLERGDVSLTLTASGSPITECRFVADSNSLLVASIFEGHKRWSAESGDLILPGPEAEDEVRTEALDIAPDESEFITANEDEVLRWDMKSGQLLGRFRARMEGEDALETARYSPDGKRILTTCGDSIRVWENPGGRQVAVMKLPDASEESSIGFAPSYAEFSPDGKKIVGASIFRSAIVWDAESGKQIVSLKNSEDGDTYARFLDGGKRVVTTGLYGFVAISDAETGALIKRIRAHKGNVTELEFTKDEKRMFSASHDGTCKIWDVETATELCDLVFFAEGGWAVIDPRTGRYDASNAGDVDGLHWASSDSKRGILEAIELGQFKDLYWTPGLLAKIWKGEKIEDLPKLEGIGLWPEVSIAPPQAGDAQIKLSLTNRGGGIGKVKVFVNDRPVTLDARGPSADPDAPNEELTVDIGAFMIPGQQNFVAVVADNSDEDLPLRGRAVTVSVPAKGSPYSPHLYVLAVGTNDYANDRLDLRLAARDAEAFLEAATLGSGFFEGRTHLTLLSTEESALTGVEFGEPTKARIEQEMKEIAAVAQPGDAVLLFFSGHGVTYTSASGKAYAYLTLEATSGDLSIEEVRKNKAVTFGELAAWTKDIKACKRALILDTCSSGQLVQDLSVMMKDADSDARIKEYDRFRDNTGFWVIAGSAADKASYEASAYGHGILTYTLLQALTGPGLRDSKYADIGLVARYAQNQVPILARNLGGIQAPQVFTQSGSFTIGEFGPAQVSQLSGRLPSPKPQLIRPVFLNGDLQIDNLDITEKVTRELAVSSDPYARGGWHDLPAWFVDAVKLQGALRPSGTYKIVGTSVTVTIRLARGTEVVAGPVEVTGDTSSLDDLAKRVAAACFDLAKSTGLEVAVPIRGGRS